MATTRVKAHRRKGKVVKAHTRKKKPHQRSDLARTRKLGKLIDRTYNRLHPGGGITKYHHSRVLRTTGRRERLKSEFTKVNDRLRKKIEMGNKIFRREAGNARFVSMAQHGVGYTLSGRYVKPGVYESYKVRRPF